MASKLYVPVTQISEVVEHPNADMLGLAQVLGYQVVVGLKEDPSGQLVRWFLKGKKDKNGKPIPVSRTEQYGFWIEKEQGKFTTISEDDVETVRYSFQYNEGDKVVYFPGDTLLPEKWADEFGVKAFLRDGNRVTKVVLRGEPSFGLVVRVPDDMNWKEGDNVAEYYGAEKYEPPLLPSDGDAAPYKTEIDVLFHKFTDIQNGRLYTNIFTPDDDVVVSEKLHGANCRVGIMNGHRVAGSMQIRRKPPEDGDFSKSKYWFPWSIPGVGRLMEDLKEHRTVELFGEVYGNKIQKRFIYDAGNGIGFKAFGLIVGSKFLDWDVFSRLCLDYDIPIVPVLYAGKFDYDYISKVIESPTLVGTAPVMEGCVVVSARESSHPKIGRKILKYISNQYDLLRNKSDCTDV